MTNKFTICLVHDKDNIQGIIDSGQINIALEEKEIESLKDALAYGQDEAILTERSAHDIQKENFIKSIDALQGILTDLRNEVSD